MFNLPEPINEKTSRLGYVLKFFKSPLTAIILSILLTLATVLFVERESQIFSVLVIAFGLPIVSFLYVIWEERISSVRYRDKNIVLEREIEALKSENLKLSGINRELEREIPKVIHYTSVRKNIKIDDDKGNAVISVSYEGINISGRPMQRVKHTIGTKKPLPEDEILSMEVNGESLTPVKDVNVECKQFGDNYHVTSLYFETTKAIADRDPINISYKLKLKEEYDESFKEKGSTSSHRISVRTDSLFTEIRAPNGFIFSPNPGIDIRERENDIEIHAEEDRIMRECSPQLDSTRSKITWSIGYPRISYVYKIVFWLRKASRK